MYWAQHPNCNSLEHGFWAFPASPVLHKSPWQHSKPSWLSSFLHSSADIHPCAVNCPSFTLLLLYLKQRLSGNEQLTSVGTGDIFPGLWQWQTFPKGKSNAFKFWTKDVNTLPRPGEERGKYSTKFHKGRLRPEVQPFTLLPIFDKKGTSFAYL